MKKRLFGTVGILALTLLVGCQGKVEEVKTEVKKAVVTRIELETYLEETNPIVEEMNVLDEEYVKKYTEEEDLAVAISYAKGIYLPAYQSLYKKAKAVKVTSPELEKVHALFLKSIETDIKGVNEDLKATETQDEAGYVEAEKLYKESEKLQSQHDKDFMKLAEEFGLAVELEEQ